MTGCRPSAWTRRAVSVAPGSGRVIRTPGGSAKYVPRAVGAQAGAQFSPEPCRIGRRAVQAALQQEGPVGAGDQAGQVQAVLVTSGNALPALPASLHGLPLLAVGDATAQRALAAGFTQVCSADGDAVALGALASTACPPGAVLLLATGAGQGWALAADLRARGFRVHRRAVYAARPVRRLPPAARDALAGRALRAALFLSADTARAFAHALPAGLHPLLRDIEALAIGQPAAEALARLPWRRVRVSAKPTLESVLALL